MLIFVSLLGMFWTSLFYLYCYLGHFYFHFSIFFIHFKLIILVPQCKGISVYY